MSAQDLEQFRVPVQAWKDKVLLPLNYSDHDAQHHAEADRLLALIDNAGKVECSDGAGTENRRERLLERRNILNNSFGSSVFGDGLLRKQIDAIDAELATLTAPHQPAPVVGDAMVRRVWELYWRAEKSGDVTVTEKEMHAIANLIARAQGVQL